jgi:hypothetical protein
MPERLPPDELAALRVRLIEGHRVDLSLLAYEDRLALRPFGWRRRRAERAAKARTAPFAEPTSIEVDEVGEIADRLVTSIRGTPLQDPRTFLRDAPPEKLSALLNARDFSRVMELRARLAPPPRRREPPPRSRQDIIEDVLARHARGESADSIAKALGLGYALVLDLTNTK